jgi:hypothetical protein
MAPAGEDDLRRQALERVKGKRDFRGHLATFVCVNAILWVVWLLGGAETDAEGIPWPLWVTGGWGIGVILHAWNVYGQRPISDRDVEEELNRIRSG